MHPKKYREREKVEHSSGVYELHLTPTPPKQPLSPFEDGLEHGGAIVMQMPSGTSIVIPMPPSSTGNFNNHDARVKLITKLYS